VDEHPTSMPTSASDASRPLRHVVVLAGGSDLSPARLAHAARATTDADLVVAADSGYRHAVALDRDVDVLVGDLDSIDPLDLARAERAATRIERHPVDKDLTDLALALDVALSECADASPPLRVTVVGGDGGRTDHLLGNALLLGAPQYAALRIDAIWGEATLHVVRDSCTLASSDGTTVSLLALHGPADGVTTKGLDFPLHDARLAPGSSLGLSNRMNAATAQVHLTSGVLLAVQPGPAHDRPREDRA
jgi:thiamine pyrophosphokinase